MADPASDGTPDDPDTPPRRRRRRWLRGMAIAVPLVLLVSVAAAWLWLAQGPVGLPRAAQDRIEAALDANLPTNRIALGEVAVQLADGGRTPEILLRDVTLFDLGGAQRAGFPELRVSLAPAALLAGEVRPTRVQLRGASLRLRRDAEGRFDLRFGGDPDAQALSLPDALARIDAVFAAPQLGALEAVTGSDLELAMTDAMTEQVMRVRDAEFRLDRTQGVLTLTVGGGLEGSRDARIDLAISRTAERQQTVLGGRFVNLAARDLATAAPALAWLDLIRAPISGQIAGIVADDGAIGDLSAGFDIGAGVLQVEGAADTLAFDGLAAALSFDAASERLSFETLTLDAPQLSFAAMGHADVSADGNVYVGQFRLSDITADPAGQFEAPLALDGGLIDLRLTLDPALRVEIGQAVVFDGDLQTRLRGEISARPGGFDVALDAGIESARFGQVLRYWPLGAVPRTRDWLATNLSEDAHLQGVDFALRAGPGVPVRSALDLDFETVELRAIPALPPITGAAGYVSLSGPRLILSVDAGQITPEAPGAAPLSLAGSRMVVEDVRPRGPEAMLDLSVAGALTDLLRLLDGPPVNLFRQGQQTPESIGTASAEVRVGLTTRLMPREPGGPLPDFAVEGTIRDFTSTTLVPERRLTAERLILEADPDRVVVRGQARLDDQALTGQWSRALGRDAPRTSRVEARTALDRAGLAALGVDLPDWMVLGQAEAQLTLDLAAEEPPRLLVRSDLDGMGLSVPAFGWSMGQGQTGELEVSVRLGPDPEVTGLRLEGAGLTLEGRAALRPGGGLDRLQADRLRVGSWLDVSGALIGTGAGSPPRIEIAGGSVDLRTAPPRGGSGGGQGAPIDGRLDRLQITDAIALTDLRAEISTSGGLSGQFRSLVNGAAPITGTLVATAEGPAMRIRSEDGGAVLRAAGLFRTLHGGPMELILRATGAPGSYEGQLEIDSPRLRDAPVMAELLNLISVVGLLEQLSGDGINLGEVDARFAIAPTRVVLREGTAVGPALGLSMQGIYDVGTRRLDMDGVVSPLYMVNGLVGALFAPRGEGLFGFAYRLTGTPEATDVNVNPLSILTPGIFRDIFRRPPPELREIQ